MNMFDCTLYNCKSPNNLQKYLLINKKEFKSLSVELNETPNKFFKSFTDDKGRELFRCNIQVTKLHKRLMKLFNVEIPIYLKSGVKKQSHITNVQHHGNSNFFLLIDVKRFYPSITKSKIKKQLITTYKQSSNVAEFISNLVTIHQVKANNQRALVTGSPLSQYFAFIVNKKMFDELNKISLEENVKFSVYVDDITFSSKQVISYKFHQKVFSVLTKYGFVTHLKGDKKTYRGKVGLKSKITGVHITKYGLRLLQKHKESIQNIITQNLQDEKGKTLLGLVYYAMQVNPKYVKYKRLLEKYNKLQKPILKH